MFKNEWARDFIKHNKVIGGKWRRKLIDKII